MKEKKIKQIHADCKNVRQIRSGVFAFCALTLIFAASSFSFSVQAAKNKKNSQEAAKEQAQNLLITKLADVFDSLKDENLSKSKVALRLGDLLSEKARRLAIKDLDGGCTTNCTMGAKERRKALGYYEWVFERKNLAEAGGPALLQAGRLYEQSGQAAKAVEIWTLALKSEFTEKNSKLQQQLWFSLAELYYRNKNYSKATPYYEKLYTTKDSEFRNKSAYRRAWCLFNSGQSAEAARSLEAILKNKDFLKSAGSNVVDEPYWSEVSYDYTVFVSQLEGSSFSKEGKLIYKLSPKTQAMKNLIYLASEWDKLGQKAEALQAWTFIVKKQKDPKEKLNSLIHLSELHRTRGDLKKSLSFYKESLGILKKNFSDCKTFQCDEWVRRVRNYVVSWDKELAVTPDAKASEKLLEGYDFYLATYSNHLDIVIAKALLLTSLGKTELAYNQYSIALETLKDENVVIRDNKIKTIKIEDILLSQLKLALDSKDKAFTKSAYEHYLSLSKDKTRFWEASYELAYLFYKEENYLKAQTLFYQVAIESKKHDLAIKSARLVMDCLAKEKKDVEIQKTSQAFASLFAKDVKEASYYQKLTITSILNQSEKAYEAKNYELALEKLKEISWSTVPPKQWHLVLKNRVITSYKLQDYEGAWSSVNQLLEQKSLDSEMKDFALQEKLILAELFLDFTSALETLKQSQHLYKEKEAEYYMKMAILADLSFQNSIVFYDKYLNVATDEKNRFEAAYQVYGKKPSLINLKKYESYLLFNSEVYLDLYLKQVYKQKASVSEVAKFLKSKKHKGKAIFAEHDIVKFDASLKVIKQAETYFPKLAKMQVDSSSEKKTQITLKKWIRVLKKGGKLLATSFKASSWSPSLYVMIHLEKEYSRFYETLMSLPLPEGLTPDEQNQYLGLLSQTAGPYKKQSKEIQAKVKDILSDAKTVPSWMAEYQKAPAHFAYLMNEEKAYLSKMVSEEQALQLASLSLSEEKAEVVDRSVLANLEALKSQVRQNPEDKKLLKQIISLEMQRSKKSPLIQYLRARLEAKGGLK